jgi:WD40 repeat protein
VRQWDVSSHVDITSQVSVTENSTLRQSFSQYQRGPACVQILQGHLDSVNSLAVTSDNRLLFSASNDCTIKLWQVGELSGKQQEDDFEDSKATSKQHKGMKSGSTARHSAALNIVPSLKTLHAHDDYVKALAYAPQTNVLASAGLDKRVLLWDIETLVERIEFSHSFDGRSEMSNIHKKPAQGNRYEHRSDGNVYAGVEGDGHKDSVYCAAISAEGNLVASGSSTPEMAIRCWDARTGKKVCKLKGHSDNIRSMVMSSDGKYIISAGSDCSMLLWDIGQQRCIRDWHVHRDSIWSLCVDSNFTSVFSGGRDQSVVRTDIFSDNTTNAKEKGSSANLQRESKLVCKEKHRVLACAFQPIKARSKRVSYEQGWVWVSGTSGDIRRWPVHSLDEDIPFGSGGSQKSLANQHPHVCTCGHTGNGSKNNDSPDNNIESLSSKESSDAKRALVMSTPKPKKKGAGMSVAKDVDIIHTPSDVCLVTNTAEECIVENGEPKPNKSGSTLAPLAGVAFPLSSSSAIKLQIKSSAFISDESPPLALIPDVELQGLPGIVKYLSLNDQRHILTQDDCKPHTLRLWDVARGVAVDSFPHGLNIEDQAEHLCATKIPGLFCCNWYSLECRLGVLNVILSNSTVFRGELFAVDAGIPKLSCPDSAAHRTHDLDARHDRSPKSGDRGQDEERNATGTATCSLCGCPLSKHEANEACSDSDGEEVKINMGEQMLYALFRLWATRRFDLMKSKVKGGKSQDPENEVVPESIGKPLVFNLPVTIPVLVIEMEPSADENFPAKDYLLSRKCISDFTGNEDESELPLWAIECVWNGTRSGQGEPLKYCFDLVPDYSFGVYRTQSNKLTAPAVIRIEKLVTYVWNRMQVIPPFLLNMVRFVELSQKLCCLIFVHGSNRILLRSNCHLEKAAEELTEVPGDKVVTKGQPYYHVPRLYFMAILNF